MVRLLIVYCRIEESSWSIEINLDPFYIEMQNFFYSLWVMTASFKGKNPVTWHQSKSLLSFVFSSAFIQQLTKSLLKVCFRFIYLHFNQFRAHLPQGSFCLELYFAPFLWACDQSRSVIKYLITVWRHNMVAISKVGNFRTRLSLSEILSDLIWCKLVRYPWFCSARPRSFTCLKMADVYHAYWSKFPSQSEASIGFLFRDHVSFSTKLLNLMYLSIFVRVAKNLALYPRFVLSIQHVSIVVHNLWKKCIRYFYSQCPFNIVGHIWLMSSSRCWDGRWCP